MLENYPENRYDVMLKTLKAYENREIPIIIKGGGKLGEQVYHWLSANGISVKGFGVDKKYYSEQMLENKPVYCFEDYVRTNECIVIIAYRGYESNQISYELRENIKYIFDYDFIGRTVLEDSYERPISKEYLEARKKDVKWLYDQLADKKSQESLDDFLYQRIYGNYRKRFDYNQYFQNDILKLCEDEIFIDCGAFRGENIIGFSEFAMAQGIKSWKAIAFEPDPFNIQIMKSRIKNLKNILFEECGVYSSTRTLYFNSGEGSSSSVSEKGNIAIKVKAIDDVLEGEKATFIKMDIEGSEMEALRGAEKTICKYKPKLAICIYHKREDFLDIPRYVKMLNPEYKLYIRNHDSAGIECVLYAI